MPKILKMPAASENRNSEATATPVNPPPNNLLPFPKQEQADLDTIARWLNLADEVLDNRKRA